MELRLLISEKSNFYIKIMDMYSKINDIENKLIVENYGFFISCVRKLNVDVEEHIDEFYIPYIEAIRKYCEDKKLQVYSLKTIIKNAIKWYSMNEYRKSNRKKRRPERGIYSYDTISYSNKIQESAYQIPIDKKAIDEVFVEQIMDRLDNQKQKIIVKMLSVGYNKTDVKRRLCISYYDLMKSIEKIKVVMINL